MDIQSATTMVDWSSVRHSDAEPTWTAMMARNSDVEFGVLGRCRALQRASLLVILCRLLCTS